MIKEKIIEYFLENPNKEINIRNLAKELNISPMSAKRETDKLAKKQLLMVTRKKLESIIKVNKETSNYLKRIHNFKRIIESGLIEKLEEEYEYPKAIILFGSYNFGEDNENSDIDIAVQTKLKKELKLDKFEKKLRKPIQIFELNGNLPENLKKSIYNGTVLKGRIQ